MCKTMSLNIIIIILRNSPDESPDTSIGVSKLVGKPPEDGVHALSQAIAVSLNMMSNK
jgi:hypothetical protein